MTGNSCPPAAMLRKSLRPLLRYWAEGCLDALLPRYCVLCAQPARHDNLCEGCLADLPRPGPCCVACALPIPAPGGPLCGSCLLRPPPWDRATAALRYDFPVDRLILQFKFHRDFACGEVLGRELLGAIQASRQQLPDLIVPVPLHRTRHYARTFNQADVLARFLGRALRIRVYSTLLSRGRRTRAQSGLDAAARRRNTRGAFVCGPSVCRMPPHAHVALVDDVLTTGATLGECARTVRRAGAARLSVWVAARA